MSQALLSVEHLTTMLDRPSGALPLVDDVSFTLSRGETLGLVGESGCGKSLTALSLVRLVQPPVRVARGCVTLAGRTISSLDDEQLRGVRGPDIGLIFQDPTAALDPVMTIGAHIAEALTVHGRGSRRAAAARAIDLLTAVRIREPRACVSAYPHQLSGGMRQRAMIAIALACDPVVLIADEPTTALDVTVQAEILDLLRELQAKRGLALLLISHDWGVVAELASRVAVMYAGRIVEEGLVRQVLQRPSHPYTKGLLRSVPSGIPGERLAPIPGAVPDASARPSGCAFHPRCVVRIDRCASELPEWRLVDGPTSAHHASCWLMPPSQ